ncbi:hypothetical protein ES703_115450 [subsurface metagenome]
MAKAGDRMKLVATDENNSLYNIVYAIWLFLRIRNNDLILEDLGSRELFLCSESNLDQVGKILSTKDLRRMAFYFLDYGAATATILQNRLGISQPSTYRYMTDLKAFNFISLAVKSRLPRGTKGGPRPEVWMVPDAELAHINDAQKLHRRLQSPKYIAGEMLGQLIMEEFLEPRKQEEITGKEVWAVAREHKIRGELSDIVFFAMNYLTEQGIKVWR